MNSQESTQPSLFSIQDLGAFWALFADNLANLILIMVVCTTVFGMPGEVVYGHILPGLGVALIFGLGSYAWLARRLAREEGRSDVTALPYGISTPILFVYLFGIIGPIHSVTGDALLAWRVGIAAAFLGGCIEALGAVAGPWLQRHLPRAGMLGTLAGIALVFIAAIPLAEIFEHPEIGLPALVVVLVGLVARVRLPGGIPAGLAAILLGVAIAFLMGEIHPNTENIGLVLPLPVAGDLIAGLQALWDHPWILGVVLPAEIYNFVETLNNVESAAAAGDRYPVRQCQLIDGAGTVLGSLFGSAFPTTVYIGHPGYKKMGGRSGYALGVGIVVFVAATFGGLALLHSIVPMAAVAPILVYVGLVITAQAFEASPREHAVAVAIAILPHISNLLIVKWGALQMAAQDLTGAPLPPLTSPDWISSMLRQGAHLSGHASLAAGSILVGLIWGSILAFLVDRAWAKASLTLASAAGLCFVGIIHAPSLGFSPSPLAWTYLALAAAFLLVTIGNRGSSRSSTLTARQGQGPR